MEYHLLYLRLCGFWWSPSAAACHNPVWYKVYATFVFVTFYTIFPLGIVIKVILFDNIFDLIDTILFMFTALGGFKMVFLLRDKARINRMFDTLAQLDSQLKTTAHFCRINVAVTLSRRLCVGITAYYHISSFALFLAPLLQSERKLMWGYWLGALDLNSIHIGLYESILVFQYVGTAFSAFVHGVVDSFAGSMYNVVSGHLDVLGERMRQLGRHDALGHCNNNDAKQQKIKREFKECVQTHLVCIE